MNQITLRGYAKLNLSLDITGRREDGYHLMDMLMQSIDLYDTISLEKNGEISVSLRMENGAESLPLDEHNTVYKAARLFFQHTGLCGGAEISLIKRIPQQAGMAGGSVDAAAVLIGLNRLYQTGLSRETLCRIGVQVGADVPFCLIGGTARVSGIGEHVRPCSLFAKGHFVVIKPPFGISTPESFRRFDSLTGLHRPDNDALEQAMLAGDLLQMARLTGNVLEQAAASPSIEQIKERLRKEGAVLALMTGSGSAVFGLFAERSAAEQAYRRLSDCGQSFLCHAVPCGVEETSNSF